MEVAVTTEQGKVKGAVGKGAVGFLGIPYAAAPVGEGRFAPPQPPQRWEGTREALAYGATALQSLQEFTLIPEPLIQGDNCLNLNVFTPDPGNSGLPVLVWIHGGGFFAGCNASPWYRGERFARDGVVLVSINYRLGIEGFLPVEDGGVNRGVLDWLAGLEWVQRNIEAFGGDPATVTVAGQSAGGVAAALLLSMPSAGGLLRRAICMSGPVALVGTAEQAHEAAHDVAHDLGTRLTRLALSEVPIERLLEAQARLMPVGPGGTPDLKAFAAGGRGMLPLAPFVDGDVVPCDPLDAVRTGAGTSCDLLTGTTTEEFNMVFSLLAGTIDNDAADIALRDTGLSAEDARAYSVALPNATGAELLGQALTDRMFRVPTEGLCDARSGADGRTYLYQSAWRSPGMGGLLGAAHCVDIPFAFDNLDAPGVEVALGSDPPQELAELMHRAWVDFVTDGDPGWPSFTLDSRPAMVFDGESRVVDDPLSLPRSLGSRLSGGPEASGAPGARTPIMTTETETAFAELLDQVAATQARMVEQLADDPTTLLEAHKWILSILQVAAETQLWADTARPHFVEIVGPYKKWGGDNADAFYGFAPIDPTRTYRIAARPGDAVYLSLTVYGGPNDGRYSERIVGVVNSRDTPPDPDGAIRIVLSPDKPAEHGVAWICLEPDAVAALTRDYLEDPATGLRATWYIEPDDPPDTFREDDADLARRLRAMTTWVREQASIVPLPPAAPNVIDPPYPVPTTTFGWAAGDAAYAMGAFDLADDEALVIRGRSPECVFWNLCLWNPLLHTYNYEYERVTINGAQVAYEPDGSWTIVVSPRRAAHPNWVSTAGHRSGRIWIRWFLPHHTPEQPQVTVVPVASL